MDLGQQGQAPDDSRARHREHRPAVLQGALGGEQGEGPEEADERVERPEVGMREDAGHRHHGEPGDDPRRSTGATAGRTDDQPDQDRERQRRGQAPRVQVEPDRVRPPHPERLERLAQRRGDPQQPATQRRVLGVVAEDGIDHVPVEEPPTPARRVAT